MSFFQFVTRRVRFMTTSSFILLGFNAAIAHTRPDVVVTDKGPLMGAVTSEGRQFLGVPYAAPPVGNLRWRAPQEVQAWKQTRLAQQFGNNCPQFGTAFGLQSFDEDCLYLNVYTPPVTRSHHHVGRAPVMVWLHPGAFQFGEGEDYDPRKLVDRNVIVVTVNYRLGALGFLAHPAFTAEAAKNGRGSSGNYALQDQQAALKWVQKNIAQFGGDPRNVTIFGESAGGMSVHTHLASPKSRGLFDRAIVQSGAYSMTQPSLAAVELEGRAFADAAGCANQDAACLRALPVTTVLANQRPGVLGFLPNIDGVVLNQSVGDAFESGRFNRVPVMEGSTHDEYRLFVPLFFDFASGPLTAELYPVGISILLGVPPTSLPAILNEYPLSNYSSPSLALGALATDAVFACNRHAATDALSHYVPTYVYEFNDATAPQRYLPPASFPYGAAHESELQYLFDIVTTLPAVPLNPTQEALSKTMVTAWTNFAHSGNPNVGPRGFSVPIWWRSNLTGYVHSFVSSRPQAASESTFAQDHRCRFWNSQISN